MRPRCSSPPLTLPRIAGRWEAFADILDVSGASPEVQLRAIEAAGATPEELAPLMLAFYGHLAPMAGYWRPFRSSGRATALAPDDPALGLWILDTLAEGWKVLDLLGTSALGMLMVRAAMDPPYAWLGELDRLRVPAGFRPFLHSEGMVFGPGTTPLDLAWLPIQLACGLQVLGPLPGLRLPPSLRCLGDLHLTRIGGLRTLQRMESPGGTLSISDCPDLERIELGAASFTEIRNCPRLSRIQGGLAGHLHVEACESLVHLEVTFPRDAIPAPAITVKHCRNLQSLGQPSNVGRVCGHLILADCPSLARLTPRLTFRGTKRIERCPNLRLA